MARLTIRFTDNEVLQGTANELDLDSPDLQVSVDGASNNRQALIPLPAVKRITLRSGPADEHARMADKMVALRFHDGEVMRGYLNGSLRRQRFGLVMDLYSPDKKSMDTVGIPYTSLKAIFYVKSWDSRPPGHQHQAQDSPPLVQLFGDLREVTRLYQDGNISRDEFVNRRRTILERF